MTEQSVFDIISEELRRLRDEVRTLRHTVIDQHADIAARDAELQSVRRGHMRLSMSDLMCIRMSANARAATIRCYSYQPGMDSLRRADLAYAEQLEELSERVQEEIVRRCGGVKT